MCWARVVRMHQIQSLSSRCHSLMCKMVVHSDTPKSVWKTSSVTSSSDAAAAENRFNSRSEVCADSEGHGGFLGEEG